MPTPNKDVIDSALAEACRYARRGGINGQPEIHVTPNERHGATCNCWCEPELHYRDPETGVAVFKHRETQ